MASDGGGFEDFYRQGYPRLVASVFALTGDWAAAQDIAQEAYERAWARWAALQGYDNAEAWLYTVARRLAVSRWRRATVAARGLVRHGPPPPVPEPSPDSVALLGALRTLPERQRQAVVLHHLLGLSVAEVAERLAVGDGTVKTWLARGRRGLAVSLSVDEPEPAQPGKGTGHG